MDKKHQPKDSHIEEIARLKQEIESYKNKYLRALADYQNFEKRINEQTQELKKIGEKQLILKLLPIIDGLDKASIFIKDQGLRQIRESFIQLLKTEKVDELDVLGKEFDPTTAEAIEMVNGEKDNMVVEILRKGYRLGESILRVAQVKVSKKIPSSKS